MFVDQQNYYGYSEQDIGSRTENIFCMVNIVCIFTMHPLNGQSAEFRNFNKLYNEAHLACPVVCWHDSISVYSFKLNPWVIPWNCSFKTLAGSPEIFLTHRVKCVLLKDNIRKKGGER